MRLQTKIMAAVVKARMQIKVNGRIMATAGGQEGDLDLIWSKQSSSPKLRKIIIDLN